MGIELKFLLFLCIQVFTLVEAFTFDVDVQPSQCDPLSISWTGGQPPFRLIVVTPDSPNLNMSIPDENFQSYVGSGSFNLSAFPVPQNRQIFFAMSDATGPISGGTSSMVTVGASVNGQSCNAALPAKDFSFTAGETLTQCGDFPFSNYPGAILPLTIFAFIPGASDSFVLPWTPPDATGTFHWKAKIKAQTQVAFSVIDSQGRKGGTEMMRIVAPSNDSSCLPAYDPGTTSPGTSDGAAPTKVASNSPSTHNTTLSAGAITGIVVGGISFLGIVLAGFIWRKRLRHSSPPIITIPDSHLISPFNSPERSPSSGGAGWGRGRKLNNVRVHRDMEEVESSSPLDLPPRYMDRRNVETYRPAISLMASQNHPAQRKP